jgi:hypothetical protein
MRLILSALIATAVAALAQAPAPRAEVAFRSNSNIPLRSIEPRASESNLGTEIILMQESRPFVVRAGITPSYTTNAFSDYTQQGDWSLEGNLSVGVQSLIAGKLLLHAEIGTAASRYDKSTSLDRDSVSVLFSTAYNLTGRTSVAAAYVGQWYMEPGYGANYLTFHTLSVRANHQIPLTDRTVLNLSPFANFISADPSDYDQVVLGGSFSLVVQETQRIEWGLAGQVQWSDYDSYFRGLFPEDRSDFSWGLSAWWAYRYSDRLDFRFDARFSHNDSNLRAFDLARGQFVGLYDYNAWQFVPSVGVNWQF